jgi:hypothetical protein
MMKQRRIIAPNSPNKEGEIFGHLLLATTIEQEEADEGDPRSRRSSLKAVLGDSFPSEKMMVSPLRITTSERNIVNDVINDSRAASDIDDLNLFIITSDPTSQKTQ